jgi:hypothetical protein
MSREKLGLREEKKDLGREGAKVKNIKTQRKKFVLGFFNGQA